MTDDNAKRAEAWFSRVWKTVFYGLFGLASIAAGVLGCMGGESGFLRWCGVGVAFILGIAGCIIAVRMVLGIDSEYPIH